MVSVGTLAAMPRPQGRPWIIAHRGASAARPENTVEAFRHAAALGADAVELDVRRTADGVLVVHHDASIDGTPIVTMSHHEMQERAPSVPTLPEALAACEGMWVNVEVKNYQAEPDWDPERRVVRGVMEIVRTTGWSERVLVSSFDLESAVVAGETLRSGWLVPTSIDTLVAIAQMPGLDTVHPAYESLEGERAAHAVADAHHRGMELLTWTVDDPDEMVRLVEAGVDGIFTNEPDVAVEALSRSR
jgi:glycerophosphoryl diester phosphodiesterase